MKYSLSNQHRKSPNCKICDGASFIFDVVDLNKICSLANPYAYGLTGIPIFYNRCAECGFIFTNHFDCWSKDDFFHSIYNQDYIKIDGDYVEIRPSQMAKIFAAQFSNHKDARILDYGAGSAVFENRLKESGFKNVTSYDPFSAPTRESGKFDIITCFEVIEHSPNPIDFIQDILSFNHENSVIIFSTGLQPADIEQIRANWWYIGPRNGHVSIYSETALLALSKKFGLHYAKGPSFQSFSRNPSNTTLPNYTLISCATIHAPAITNECWHEEESSKVGAFRWSKKSRIDYRLPEILSLTILKLKLPFINVISNDFLNNSHFELNGQMIQPQISAIASIRTLEIAIKVTPQDKIISLVTPPPLSNGKDKRELGIAVLTKEVLAKPIEKTTFIQK